MSSLCQSIRNPQLTEDVNWRFRRMSAGDSPLYNSPTPQVIEVANLSSR